MFTCDTHRVLQGVVLVSSTSISDVFVLRRGLLGVLPHVVFVCRPQVELHPYLVQTEMINFCKSESIALTAYSPFGSPARPPEL